MTQEFQNPNDRSSNPDWALFYHSLGFSVLPLCSPIDKTHCHHHGGECESPGKRPILTEWRKYQSERADENTIRSWWQQWPNANVGIVTGKISGFVVVDVDTGGSTEGLTPTVMTRTGSGGTHFLYKCIPGVELTVAVGLRPHVDFRGEGGLIVAPPSRHYSGNQYEWIAGFDVASMVELPNEVIREFQQTHTDTKKLKDVISGVNEGQRNHSATVVAGKLFKHLPYQDWGTIAWPLLQAWNTQNKPPLSEGELHSVARSIAQRELDSRRGLEKQNSFQKPQLLTGDDILALDLPPMEYIVESLIPKGGISMVTGASGCGKSMIVLYLLLYASRAERVFCGHEIAFNGLATRKVRTLFINEENSISGIQKRIRKLGGSAKDILYCHKRGFKITEDEWLRWLIEKVRELSVEVVVFDTFVRIHDRDENNSTEMNTVYEQFKVLTEETGVTVVLIHHNRKLGQLEKAGMESARGSSDISAMLESQVLIQNEKLRDGKKGFIAVITQVKSREDILYNPFRVNVYDSDDGSRILVEYRGEVQAQENKMQEAYDRLSQILPQAEHGMTYDEAHATIQGVGNKNVDNALKKLREEGLAESFTGGREGDKRPGKGRSLVFYWIDE